ncbi:MAG: hypothetical protein IKR13_05320 [Victivallales bacterium]|nr:hypothetical protein [Victivallales bacterium]
MQYCPEHEKGRGLFPQQPGTLAFALLALYWHERQHGLRRRKVRTHQSLGVETLFGRADVRRGRMAFPPSIDAGLQEYTASFKAFFKLAFRMKHGRHYIFTVTLPTQADSSFFRGFRVFRGKNIHQIKPDHFNKPRILHWK